MSNLRAPGVSAAVNSLARPGRLWLAGALLVTAGLLAGHLALYHPYTADDAFISFRYARNFALGHGLVFNVGERVEGYSTWSWVVLLGLLNRAGLEIAGAAKWLNPALALATALLLALWGRRLHPAAPWAAPLLAADASFAYWGANGMEMPLTALLLLCGGALHLAELARPTRPPISALLLGALALSRPEGAWFFGLTALHRLLTLAAAAPAGPIWRDRWGGFVATGQLKQTFLNLAFFTFAFALLFVPFLLWRYSYYGAWLPNTVTVKAGLRLRALLEGGLSLYQFVEPRAAGLALLAAGLLAARGWWRRPWASYAALLLAGNALFVVLSGGDWMPLERFWVIVLPWWYLLAAFAVWELAGALGAGRWRGAALAGMVALGLAGSLHTRLVGAEPQINNAGPTVARWLGQVTRPGDVVASNNIGAIGYGNMDLVIVDMVGLTDARIARAPARFPGGLLGRGDGFGHWDSAYVLSRRPRLIEIPGVSAQQARTWSGRAGWAGADDMYRNPEFRRLYRYADHSYFVRIDDPLP